MFGPAGFGRQVVASLAAALNAEGPTEEERAAAAEEERLVEEAARLAQGEFVIKRPSPLIVLEDTYDHSFY